MIAIKDIQIKKAVVSDAERLTSIAFAAKKHWNYPEHYYNAWKNELTITSEYIIQNTVYNAIIHNSIIGFYSITEVKSDFMAGDVPVKKGFWLEHVFIIPEFHKYGIGRLFISHARKIAQKLGAEQLWIFVDPFARGFYEKTGAKYQFDSKSSIPGRLVPVYTLNTDNI